MKLEGIHHITAITGDAQAQRRLLRRHARAADGQEDRQPGRAERLPPLLRRRAGRRGLRHHVLRVPRRARGPRRAPGWSTGSSGGSARPRRSTSGPSGSPPPGSTPSATATACASPTPRGSSTSSSSPRSHDQPLIADHPEVPAELALQGFHGARAYSADPERSAGAARQRSSSSAPTTAGRRAATPAAASGPTTSRPPSAGSRAPAPSTTSPGRRRWTSTWPGASARSPAARARPR